MSDNIVKCCVCGIGLPNKWAVAKRERVDGEEKLYCHLHANETYGKKTTEKLEIQNENPKDETEKGIDMSQGEEVNVDSSANERKIVDNASSDLTKKAWDECAKLVGKLGGGIKTLWSRINPDRSPAAMLEVLNNDLAVNQTRINEMRPQLDQAYSLIVTKKKEYQSAPPVRQRLLKIELQTLLARYKGLEREFMILSENECSIETVKRRFLEILAYGMRGKLDAGVVDKLTDDIDKFADDAECVQDALNDLGRAGKRNERTNDDLDAELADFDGELGLASVEESINTPVDKEKGEGEDELSVLGAL